MKKLKLFKFKSKEEKNREKLLKDYEEGKIVKIETPNPQGHQKNKKNKKRRH
jgi:hypothetical protein